VKMTVL